MPRCRSLVLYVRKRGGQSHRSLDQRLGLLSRRACRRSSPSVVARRPLVARSERPLRSPPCVRKRSRCPDVFGTRAVWRIAAALQALLSIEARVGLAGPCHATSHSLGVLAEHAVRRSLTPNTPPDSQSRGMPPARRLPGCAAGWWPGDRGRRSNCGRVGAAVAGGWFGWLWLLGLWSLPGWGGIGLVTETPAESVNPRRRPFRQFFVNVASEPRSRAGARRNEIRESGFLWVTDTRTGTTDPPWPQPNF